MPRTAHRGVRRAGRRARLAGGRRSTARSTRQPASLLACGVITGVGAVRQHRRGRTGQRGRRDRLRRGRAQRGAGRPPGGRGAIVAVDLQPAKLDLARRLGATHVANPGSDDVAAGRRRGHRRADGRLRVRRRRLAAPRSTAGCRWSGRWARWWSSACRPRRHRQLRPGLAGRAQPAHPRLEDGHVGDRSRHAGAARPVPRTASSSSTG